MDRRVEKQLSHIERIRKICRHGLRRDPATEGAAVRRKHRFALGSRSSASARVLTARAPSGRASGNGRVFQLSPVRRAVAGFLPPLMDKPAGRRIAPFSADCFEGATTN